MAKIPVAVQLYSIRDACAKDLPGTLKEVARMGYQGVEFAGYHNFTAADVRKMLDDNGLKAAGTHIGIPTLLGDEFEKTVAFNKVIGNIYLIVPGLPPEYRSSIEQWKKTADLFNDIADKLAKYGLFTGYHNHTHEFAAENGVTPWDAFFSRAKTSVVMQADSGNALHGGADVIPLIRRYPGRARTVHLKEYSKTNDKALIGEGDVRWNDLFQACETVGATQWYIVEQESYAFPPLECVRKCLENVRKMGR
jgi:sugar phosphate isomerase/epimerase